MTLVLTLDHRRTGRETRMLEAGTLSIGRSTGNDWVLDDPDRQLSKTHCVVSMENNRYVLTDLSTNGVFVNGANEPVGRDGRVVLTDGDAFRLADYTIVVAEQAGLPRAPALRAAPPGAFADDDLLGGGLLDDPFGSPLPDRFGAPSGAFVHPVTHVPSPVRHEDPFDVAESRHRPASLEGDPFAAHAPLEDWAEPTQPDHAAAPSHAFESPRPMRVTSFDELDFDALLGDMPPGQPEAFAPPSTQVPALRPAVGLPPAAAAPQAAGSPQTPARPLWPGSDADISSFATIAPTPPQAAPATAKPAVAVQPTAQASDASAALAAFLEGAGVSDLRVSQNPQTALRDAGAILRVMVEGLREVLMSRSAIKNELRVEQTMLRTRDNNALKFSVTVEEALAALLLPDRPGYKKPLDAAREAYADVRSHEMAVMAGVQTALIGLLKRFDPQALEGRLQTGRLDIMPGARKARIWELFCATYTEIAREAEDDFQSVFGREFAKAYDAQMKKL